MSGQSLIQCFAPGRLNNNVPCAGLWVSALVFVCLLSSFEHAAFAQTAMLSWTAPANNTDGSTPADLSGYKVYFGTSSGTYGAPINVGNVTSYTVTGLGSGTYYFAVTAYNTSGDESGFSNEVSKSFATGPVISGVASQNITATGATISWLTDVASSSQVEYGTTTAYSSTMIVNTALVTSHSVTLTGLTASTTYHFQVMSVDANNNVSTSGDGTFTTQAASDTPPVITGVAASSLTSGGAVITWTTDEAATSQVDYGLTAAYGISSALNGTLVTGHSITLSGLTPSTTYHYQVNSEDGSKNLASAGDFTFTTTAAPDTTPPVITGVTAGLLTSTDAVITWTTDEAATSQVDYGLTAAYGTSSALNGTLVTGHSITLSGLTPSTTYHYQVNSVDGSKNLASAGDYTFTTSGAETTLVISNVTISQLASTKAVITWTTNEAATSQVNYGLTSSYGDSSALKNTLVMIHSVTLNGLSASTTYHLQAVSVDATRKNAVSEDTTFTTLGAQNNGAQTHKGGHSSK
jgi:hypothetical protein